MTGKVIFIGAGPGAPDLITVRGYQTIQKADCIIYAGSLVNKKVLDNRKSDAKVFNSAELNLNEIITIMEKATSENKLVCKSTYWSQVFMVQLQNKSDY